MKRFLLTAGILAALSIPASAGTVSLSITATATGTVTSSATISDADVATVMAVGAVTPITITPSQ